MAEIEIAPRIVINEAIHPGRPIVRGTRIPAALILGSLSAGMTTEEIAREYDVLEEDIRAVLDYARTVIEHESVFTLPTQPTA